MTYRLVDLLKASLIYSSLAIKGPSLRAQLFCIDFLRTFWLHICALTL